MSDAGWSIGKQDTVNQALARAVKAGGEAQWLDFEGELLSYAEMDRRSTRMGNALAALGVTAGQTVLTFLDNSIDALTAMFGILKLGAINVPINTALRGEFLRHQVNDAGAAIMIAEPDYAERVAELGALTHLKRILYRGQRPNMGASALALGALDDHRGTDETPIPDMVKPGDLGFLIYTAGTTGPAKGCMIPHNFACNLATQNNDVHLVTQDDILWTCLPLFHFNAIAISVVASLLKNARVAMYRRFSVTNFWPEILRTRATVASVLGTMATLLAKADDSEAIRAAFGQLRSVQGAPWPPEVATIWEQRFGIGCKVAARVYGISEACCITQVPIDVAVPPGSSGRRNADFDVRIVDEEDREQPPGVPGEVICRPRRPNIMFQGYWQRPEATLSVIRNMWLYMGDVGMFDEAGFFYFVDRKKDYLRRRGENVSSFEMESVFGTHPDVQDVAVHAVLSELSEDDIKITAVLREGATLSEADLCRWCIDKVPYYAIPRYIEFRTELPKNQVGRVLKYQLRDDGCTATTWDFETSDIVVKRR